MNSVHEQYPNSDPKQCIVTKLGWVHTAHTKKPGRTHTGRTVPRSWAMLRAHPTSRAHAARKASAGRALAGRALVATRLSSLPQVVTSKLQVATPNLPSPCLGQVATLNLGRDPFGDYPMSRHQFHGATSFLPTTRFPGRDAKNPSRDLPSAQPK